MATLLNIDSRELVKLKQNVNDSDKIMMREVLKTLRAASFAVEARIKKEMPVLTGRARASWGHWTPQGLRGRAGAAISAADSVWVENDNGLSITQGSNVPYITELNEGSSRKAPAGFIDRAVSEGQTQLDIKLGFVDPIPKG